MRKVTGLFVRKGRSRFKLFAAALVVCAILPFAGILGYNLHLDPDEIFSEGVNYPFINGNPNYYRNAGIINNYDMNNLVLGASLIQNMVPSEVEKVMGWNNVFTLTFSGGKVNTIALAANYAMRRHKIDNIVFSLQPLTLATFRADVPVNDNAPEDFSKLYDVNPLNDILIFAKLQYHSREYKKKRNAFGKLVRNFPEAKKEELFTASKDLYAPYMRNRYADFNRPLFIAQKGRNREKKEIELVEEHKKNVRENIEQHLLPMVEKHPGTMFHFVLESSSFMRFKNNEEILSYAIKEVVKALSGYPNVRIHGFLANDFNADLRLFKDASHGHIEIERYIIQSLKSGRDRVTAENVDRYTEKLSGKIRAYEVPDIWKVASGKTYPKNGYITYRDAAKIVWGREFSEALFESIPRSPYLAEESYVEVPIKTWPPLNATRQELERMPP